MEGRKLSGKRIFRLCLSIFCIFLLIGCENKESNLKVFYDELYIDGHLVFIEPMIEDAKLRIPIITNREIDDVKFVKLKGENVNDLTVLMDNISLNQSRHKQFFISFLDIKLSMKELFEPIVIQGIEFTISAKKHQKNITLPLDVKIEYRVDLVPSSIFFNQTMFIDRTDYSLKGFTLGIRPKETVKLIEIENKDAYFFDGLWYGRSETTDFNEWNDLNLIDYNDLDNLDILMEKDYNQLFQITMNNESDSRILTNFSLVLIVELISGEQYKVYLDNFSSNIINETEAYIDYHEGTWCDE